MLETLVMADTRMRVRALQALLGAVALLAGAAATLVVPAATLPLAVAAGSVCIGAALPWAADQARLRGWPWHAGLGWATVALAALAILGEGGTVSTAAVLLLPGVGLCAALFLGRRGAAVHLVLAAASYGFALWIVGARAPGLAWAALLVTLAAVAGTAGWLSAQTRSLAQTDPMTHVANRRCWEHTVSHECARAGRTGHPLCVAVLSVDGFREYAFERGHAAADLLLQEAAEGWQRCIRAGDLLGRLRSDEFAVLLPECGVSVARLVTDRLLAAMPDTKTCSVGIASWDGAEPPEALINRAVDALRVAQRTGRAQSFVAAA